MQRTTKTSAKFTKLVEKTHQLKEELLNSNHYGLISDIAGWEHKVSEHKLPDPVLEHQAYLDTGIDAQEDE